MNNKGNSIWSKRFILCMILSMFVSFAYGMLNPVLSVYASTLGIMTDVVGTILSVASLLCMVARLTVGGFSEFYGKKRLILIATSMCFVGYIFYLNATSVVILFIARCLQAVGQGMTLTLMSIMVIESLPAEKLGSGIGIFSLSSSLSQCIAPMIGSTLAGQEKYKLLFILCVFISGLAVVLAIQIREEHRQEVKVPWNTLLNPKSYICIAAMPAAIMMIFNGIIYSAVANYLTIYGFSEGILKVGVFFIANSCTMVLTRPLSGYLSDKKPLWMIMLPAYLAQAAACFMVAQKMGLLTICIGGVFYGFGFGSSQAAIQIMAVRSVDASRRALANSTYYFGGDIGLSIGAFSAGVLAQTAGYEFMYMVMGIMALVCGSYFLIYNNRKEKRKNG